MSTEHFTNIVVSNLPAKFTEAKLKELFKKYGEIVSYKLNENGTGFINFKQHSSAKSAIDELNLKHKIDD